MNTVKLIFGWVLLLAPLVAKGYFLAKGNAEAASAVDVIAVSVSTGAGGALLQTVEPKKQ